MLSTSLIKRFKRAIYDIKVSNLKTIWYDLQSLDSQNYGSWPIFLRCFILLLILLMTLVLGYTLLISSQLDQQQALETQYQTLIDSQHKLAVKAGNIDKTSREIQRIRQQVQHAIQPLQQENKMTEMMEQLNLMAVESGVVFKDVSVAEKVYFDTERVYRPENNNKGGANRLEHVLSTGEYSEQSVSITVSGNYHKFGAFLNRFATLDYAININEYEVYHKSAIPETQQQSLNHPLLLTMSVNVYQSHKVQEPISQTN